MRWNFRGLQSSQFGSSEQSVDPLASLGEVSIEYGETFGGTSSTSFGNTSDEYYEMEEAFGEETTSENDFNF